MIQEELIKLYESNQKKIDMCIKYLNDTRIDGTLNINTTRSRPQFVHNAKSGRHFLNSTNPLIKLLAQKDYCERALKLAEQENKWIEKVLKSAPTQAIKDIYLNDPIRRSLITPFELNDEEYIKHWLDEPYQGKGIGIEQNQFDTERGEKVRSKSEALIANKLYQLGIPYKYECPLSLKSYGVVYPDFTILNTIERKEYIYEHFGMMDDPLYEKKTISKINTYEQNGFVIGKNLIVSFEDKNNPLNLRLLENKLRAFFL